MDLILAGICLPMIIRLYFKNNLLRHSRWFLLRRFINRFPPGMTGAFFYMGRYNLNVAKNAPGTIFAAGTVTFAATFLINPPFVDKIGGKKGILISRKNSPA
jgi:OPA family glycerol-3-phosphate transporter-like MFS transporter